MKPPDADFFSIPFQWMLNARITNLSNVPRQTNAFQKTDELSYFREEFGFHLAQVGGPDGPFAHSQQALL